MSDDTTINRACAEAHAEGQEISDTIARMIASQWHSGGGSIGYRFVSTGAIADDPSDTWWSLFGGYYEQLDDDMRLQADMLSTYLLRRSDRGPVVGWDGLWQYSDDASEVGA